MLILCEPSVIWPPVHEHGNQLLEPYVRAVHELTSEFSIQTGVPLHRAFNSVRAARPDIPLTTDGVHPTTTGHMLIANCWLQTVQQFQQ